MAGRSRFVAGRFQFAAGRENISGGQKNVHPFSYIKCSKLARFSFDISLPQYGNPTQVKVTVPSFG